ncbi:MAG: YtoQ family protein [Cyclobacteriaceae bacterium]|nr:YtoQ family protein [Cyclobacteriaceae bacterium]
MNLIVYLSGEIHSNWREEIINSCKEQNLPIEFLNPVIVHEASDDVGVKILGTETEKFWYDHKAAKINAIRTKTGIQKADLVVIKFGDKYRQWNAAFDAGQAAALGKPYIVIHPEEFTHALKEVDAQAMAVTKTSMQVVEILNYVSTQK